MSMCTPTNFDSTTPDDLKMKMTRNLSMAYNLVLLVSLSASKPLMGLLITDSPHLSWARCRLYQACPSSSLRIFMFIVLNDGISILPQKSYKLLILPQRSYTLAEGPSQC